VKHFVITRFQYPKEYKFMEERIELFNKFTKPSICNQTCKDFEWIILGNPDVDIPIKHKFISGEGEGKAPACWVNAKELYQRHIDYMVKESKGEDLVLMTRVDNDDILLPNYVENAQRILTEPGLLEFKGYRLDLRTNEFYIDHLHHEELTSPFLTLAQRPENLKSVYSHNHSKMWQHFDLKISEKRNWVQVIHAHNWVLNRPSPVCIRKIGQKIEIPALIKEMMGE